MKSAYYRKQSLLWLAMFDTWDIDYSNLIRLSGFCGLWNPTFWLSRSLWAYLGVFLISVCPKTSLMARRGAQQRTIQKQRGIVLMKVMPYQSIGESLGYKSWDSLGAQKRATLSDNPFFCNINLVEAVGIEPTSGYALARASTCLALRQISQLAYRRRSFQLPALLNLAGRSSGQAPPAILCPYVRRPPQEKSLKTLTVIKRLERSYCLQLLCFHLFNEKVENSTCFP